ncbi:hypothetical protein U0070_021661 [Myodes glareolus]|uniref:F-box/LRR-repeat protein 15-like leucin rich repeat domain-containing protein n=1 Tax=Myodes glareolus TaxID=447135 RepID=A0AAW0IR41_MYOGA
MVDRVSSVAMKQPGLHSSRLADVISEEDADRLRTSWRVVAVNCRNIEHLNLNGCTKITDSTCYSLSRFCSKLKHLDLTSCVSVTNSSLKGISDGCRNLEYLNLSWCDQITKEGIEALVRGCRGLKALLLRGCTQVQRPASGQPVPLAVAVILVPDMFSHLGSIPLSFPPSTQLEDEALKHIQHHCHELVSLNLQSCSVSMDPGACAQPHCPSCPRPTACRTGAPAAPVPPLPATPACSPIVWPHMPKRITDEGVVQICRGCHRLQALCLSGCSNLTDASLTALGLNCPRLQ